MQLLQIITKSPLVCPNTKCRSSSIAVGYDGQPAQTVFGVCRQCGVRGPSAVYNTTDELDMDMFKAKE